MANRSKRLEVIISFLKKGSYIADIGSDHAYVPINAVAKGIARKAIAIENKAGPYKAMKENIASSGYGSLIASSLSDGLDELPEEADGLVLAGMGGLLVRDILFRGEKKLSHISYVVIDAHSDYPPLLSYLAEQRFYPADDLFFYEKEKPYCVYLFEKGEKRPPYSELELAFGPIEIRRKSKEWRRYNERKLAINEEILSSSSLPSEKKNELEKENRLIRLALEDQSERR